MYDSSDVFRVPEEDIEILGQQTTHAIEQLERACHEHGEIEGCAYDRGVGPEHCPILSDSEGESATDENGYLSPDPWTYLKELGAQVAILSASCPSQPEIRKQCQETLAAIVKLERMLDIIPI